MPREVVIEETEEQRVQRWREDVLIDAGCAPEVARYLSLEDGDLHKMVKAKEAGCTDKVLRRIFG